MSTRDDAWKAAKTAFDIQADALLREKDALDRDAFLTTVELLASAPRIGASGCGHSGIACQHFAHLMCCIERPARFLSPAEAVHGAMGFLQAGDVMLLASRGCSMGELLPIRDLCLKKGMKIIAVTENLTSPLTEGADAALPMRVTRETDRYNSQGTTSTTVLSALLDALQSALIKLTDFHNERFALNHPGGAVGERLNREAP